MTTTRTWQDELDIIDRTMKKISGVTDPQQMVEFYWDGISELQPVVDYIALSRRDVEAPHYLVTRSSRFVESLNPWTQRDQLPKLAGGLLGELAYANKPIIIDNLQDRLLPDDPGHFYLDGFARLIALPQYDGGEAMNVSILLLPESSPLDLARVPMMHWHTSLFGRGTQTLVLRNQLEDALKLLDSELQVVGEIQRTLLPSKLPEIPGYAFASFYRTSARAGGDYYDFFSLDDDGLGLFIADVSGHGTPAAVLMAITHAIAHSKPGTHTPPCTLLEHLNERLTRSYLRAGMFVTAFYAVLDPQKRRFTYARAGHNPPRLVRKGQVLSLDAIGSLPMGVLENETFQEHTLTLEPGDLLVLYTDGITEAMGPKNAQGRRELFGLERLDEILLAAHDADAQTCIDRIVAAVDAFTCPIARQSAPQDDQTLIAIRCE